MLKACSSLVIPFVSWSDKAPCHCIQSLLVSPRVTEVVSGGSNGEIIIWSLQSNGKVHDLLSVNTFALVFAKMVLPWSFRWRYKSWTCPL